MIGFIAGHNDVYAFFENEKEIEELDKKDFVKGNFINKTPEIRGVLEIIIDDSIENFTKTSGEADESFNFKNYRLKIKRKKAFEELRDYGDFCNHDGFRHVNLINVEFAKFSDKQIYGQACLYRNKFSK